MPVFNGGNDSSNIRICDADREAALQSLSTLTSRGYITLAEFEDRSRAAMSATTRGDIDALFSDIPQQAFEHQPLPQVPQMPPTPHPLNTHTATPSGIAPLANTSYLPQEVAPFAVPDALETHRNGRHVRNGVMALTAVSMIALDSLTNVDMFFWFIPIVAILLYVIKIGPASWYAPTPKQIAKVQQKQLKSLQNLETKQRRKEILSNTEEIARLSTEKARRFLER